MANRHLFARFTKIDEEKREVAGRLTQEIVDRDGEIWDYDSSVAHVKAWSDSFADATDGKSLGNLRAMHQPISAGKVTAIEYNDAEKAIDIVVKVVDDAEWQKTLEGLYTGFSIGGRVVRSWRDSNDPTHKRFEIRPIEASLADLPSVPTATFTYVKTGGVAETRGFTKLKTIQEPRMPSTKPTTFADAANRRFPIDTKSQTRVSIAAWGKTAARAKSSAEDQATIISALLGAATSHGIAGVTEKALAELDYAKGLYDVARFADLIQSLAYLQQSAAFEREYEGDESTVPDSICDAIASLLASLETMVGEEGDELLRMLGFDVVVVDTADVAAAETAKTAAAAGVAAAGSTSTATAEAADATRLAVAATDTAAASDTKSPVTEKVVAPIAAGAADAPAADFTKAMAKKHAAALNDLADQGKAIHKILGDHVDKMASFCKDMGGEGAADEDASDKIASSEFQKVAGERDTWEKRARDLEAQLAAVTTERDTFQKTAADLAVAGVQLADALETKKGSLIAIDREADGVAALGGAKTEKTAKTEGDAGAQSVKPEGSMADVNQEQLYGAFKKAFRNPGLPAPQRRAIVTR